MLCDPDSSECYWALIDDTSLVRTPEGAKVAVQKANRLAESGDELAEIAIMGKSRSSKISVLTFVFPLDANYRIDLNDEELEALCAEASLALSRPAGEIIDVQYSVEGYVAMEADSLRSINGPTPAVITAILFYTDRQGLTDKESWSVTSPICAWQLRLA